MMRWAVDGARWFLVMVFLATAIGKLLDNRGFAEVLGQYRLFPAASLLPLGLFFSLVELAVAFGLAHGPTLRMAAVAAGLLMLGNAAVLALTLARGIALENCGCFGVFLARPLAPWSPLEDVALAGLAGLVLLGTRKPA
jgi:hypothetical protein